MKFDPAQQMANALVGLLILTCIAVRAYGRHAPIWIGVPLVMWCGICLWGQLLYIPRKWALLNRVPVTFCIWEGRPALYVHGEAWAVIDGYWKQVDSSAVEMSATEISADDFQRRVRYVPTLPSREHSAFPAARSARARGHQCRRDAADQRLGLATKLVERDAPQIVAERLGHVPAPRPGWR
jgi:hypothetical protein